MNWEGRSPVNRHSMQSYIMNYRLRKREPLIDMGSHEGGPKFSESVVPQCERDGEI